MATALVNAGPRVRAAAPTTRLHRRAVAEQLSLMPGSSTKRLQVQFSGRRFALVDAQLQYMPPRAHRALHFARALGHSAVTDCH